MTYNYADKVAIVTGDGSGIGEACVQKLAESGANIIVDDLVAFLCSEQASFIMGSYYTIDGA